MFSWIRTQYIRAMSKLWVRKVYLVVGSTILVGLFYRPFLLSILSPRSRMTEEELKYYDLDDVYVVKKRKEQLASLQRGDASVDNKGNSETKTKRVGMLPTSD